MVRTALSAVRHTGNRFLQDSATLMSKLDRRNRIRPRLSISDGFAIGPGKIDLLIRIGETQSISAAARVLGMSYKRAWQLIDEVNRGFGRPVVETAIGGKGGGGARLTGLGRALLGHYAALENEVNSVAARHVARIARLASD